MKEHGDLFLVAEKNSRIVGTIIVGWDGWRGNIYRLAVLSAYRRQGIARALVQAAERLLFATGACRLSLLVEHQEPRAVAFWESLYDIGYERDPRVIRYVKTL